MSQPTGSVVARCDAFVAAATRKNFIMLKWAIISAVIAIIAGAMGFGIIAGTAAAIAKIFFFLFLTLFLVLLISTIVIGRKVKSGVARHLGNPPGPRAR